MPYSFINDVPNKTSYIVFLFGIFGAIINYGRRKNRTLRQRILLFISDMISSVMLSIITFTTVTGAGGTELLAVGLSGFVAHQGTRAVYLMELIIAKKFNVSLEKEIATEVKEKQGA